MTEEWRDIAGYEGKYMVSNTGKVKSLNYSNTGKEGILEAHANEKGYLRVMLCKDGKKKVYRVHRLVAQAFIPNPDNLPQVNHIDENKENNCMDNLEWVTCSENINHGTRNQRVVEKLKGRKLSEESVKKVAEKLSKPVFSVDKVTGEIKNFPSAIEASRQTGIDKGNITRCCQGKLKSAKGFYWHYVDDKEVANE